MEDSYWTIEEQVGAELKVRGSWFRAEVFPLRLREDAERFLEGVRRRYHDATHHCSAYRLGVDGSVSRAQDDGEPSGSAGKPILAAIDSHGLTDVLVVVTRYFGGTKLGVGGLVRAYSEAADAALRRARRVERFLTVRLQVRAAHAHVGTVLRLASRHGARVVEITYDESVGMVLDVRRSAVADLRQDIREATRGAVNPSEVETPLTPSANAREER